MNGKPNGKPHLPSAIAYLHEQRRVIAAQDLLIDWLLEQLAAYKQRCQSQERSIAPAGDDPRT